MLTRGIWKSRFNVLLLMISLALLSVSARAQSGDDRPAHPAISTIFGNTGQWKVFNADNLPAKTASFNVFYDRINRNPGYLTISTVGISGAVGLTDWLELGMNFEINKHMLARRQDQLSFGQQSLGLFGAKVPGSPALPSELMPGTIFPQLRDPATRAGALTGTAGYYNSLPFIGSSLGSNGVGTVTMGLKVNMLSEERGNRMGLAVRGYGVIPTHRNVNFLLNRPTQTGDWIFGSDIILSKNVGSMAELNYNVGYRSYESPGEGRNILLSDEVPMSVGLVIPRKTMIQVMAELTSDILVGNHTPAASGDRNPVDATIGFRAFPIRPLAVSLGYRHTLNQSGGDKNGFVADVSYSTGEVKKAPPVAPSLTCTADPTEVFAGSLVNLSAQAVSSAGKAITYEWSTTGGTIEGSGPTVKLHTDNLSAGTYTATVKAWDTPGVTADCAMRVLVKVQPPPPMPPTVACSADRPSVRTGEIVTLNAQAKSPQDRPLKYTWTNTVGRIEGSGASVKFDTTGVAAGTYTVRVTVTDDRNLSAECSISVTVTAPPPPPPPPPPAQVSKLGECQFKANSPRVDNVCKAKLDDAALRLRNEADSTLAVVGFADTRERRSAQTADSRANNIKGYLVNEKGIADGRVSARRGTTARGNEFQRAEIYLVPRGATFSVGELVTAPTPKAAAPRRPAAKAPAKKSAEMINNGIREGSASPVAAQSAALERSPGDAKRIVIARAQ